MAKINPKPVTGYRLLVSEPSMNDDTNSFINNISEVWNSRWLTNGGPKILELESKIKEKYTIPNISVVVNGTVALQMAIRSLNLPKGGNIITTPFTWISSTSSILWEGYKPRFVDIDPHTLNIDPKKIEEAIDEDTVAILAVHVFSNPCAIEEIKTIANKHNLKIIYDAAHAFGVSYKGKDVSVYGDVSIHSYHATKVYNTGEGGAIISTDKKLMERIEHIRTCGLNEKKEIVTIGTNAKVHEVTACIGLANLEVVDKSIEYRKELYQKYVDVLKPLIDLERIRLQKFNQDSYNYSYFPVIFETEDVVLKVNELLKGELIMARRYFYPSLNKLKWGYGQKCPISEDISKRILCLPSHDRVTDEDVKIICSKILNVIL
jgi:dTDP-4-amino-4,6-dideoxygalactose transaminase